MVFSHTDTDTDKGKDTHTHTHTRTHTHTDREVTIRLRRKRLYPIDSVKYLGVRIDKNFNWKHHVNDIQVSKYFNNILPSIFDNFSILCFDIPKQLFAAIFQNRCS